MFCTKCGVAQQPEARFCGNCGSQFPFSPDGLSEKVAASGAAPALAERKRTDYWHVEVGLEFQGYQPDEKMAAFKAEHVMLTEDAIWFLDKSGHPVSHQISYRSRWQAELNRSGQTLAPLPRGDTNYPWEYGSVWVLKQSLNEQLDREFRANPGGYVKIHGAWWVYGSRNWIWINEIPTSSGSSVTFSSLMRALSVAQWSEGRQVPTVYREVTAHVSFQDSRTAEEFKQGVKSIIGHESGRAFSDAYIASIPVNPTTIGKLTYFYVFWTGLAAAVMAGVLSSIGVSPGTEALLLIGGCIGVVYFLRRWRQRLAQRGPLTRYVSK